MRTRAITAKITPDARVPLFGRGNRPGTFEFVASELEANLLVLPGVGGLVVLASLDTLFACSEFKAAVMDRLGAPHRFKIRDLVLIASHTHFAPALDPGKPRLGKVDSAYFDLAARRVAAALEALSKAELANTRMKRGRSYSTLNASRSRMGIRLMRAPPFFRYGANLVPSHGRRVPRDITAIVAEDEEGTVSWVIWHYACHATAAPEQPAISSDYPGEVRASLRRYFNIPDLPVLFFPGFCGDLRPDPALWPIDPRHLILYPFQRPFARPTPVNFRFFCDTLSCQVEAACRHAQPLAPASVARVSTAEIPLVELIDGANPGAMQMIYIDAGPMTFVFISAEVCSCYLAKLEKTFPPGTLMSGYTDDVYLYLPDDKQISEGAMNPENSFLRSA